MNEKIKENIKDIICGEMGRRNTKQKVEDRIIVSNRKIDRKRKVR